MERKALGKGLNALITENTTERREAVVYVSPEKIRPNSLQPREYFDEHSIAELAQSIKEKGIIQPLIVRRMGDTYELIAGERRLRACNSLQLKEIPVIVKNVEDRDSLELALIENIQREALNPIEEARAYHYLLEKFQITQEKISEVLGKARTSVANSLRLLKLPPDIQEEMKKLNLSFGHGRALLEMEDQGQQRRLAQEVVSKGLSVRELENLIKARRPRALRRRNAQSYHDPILGVYQERLQHALATRIRIVKQKKRGHIIIEFYSQEDLDRIIHTIENSQSGK